MGGIDEDSRIGAGEAGEGGVTGDAWETKDGHAAVGLSPALACMIYGAKLPGKSLPLILHNITGSAHRE